LGFGIADEDKTTPLLFVIEDGPQRNRVEFLTGGIGVDGADSITGVGSKELECRCNGRFVVCRYGWR
jgi:hypothetical protein